MFLNAKEEKKTVASIKLPLIIGKKDEIRKDRQNTSGVVAHLCSWF